MKNGKWLQEKLAQNGYTPEDLAAQSGLDMDVINKLLNDNEGTAPEWDLVLDILNSYPAVRYPGEDLFADLKSDLQNYNSNQPVCLYYGVNQKELIFCGYTVEGSMAYHGSNVDYEQLFRLMTTLEDAAELFKRQSFTE